MTILLFSSSAKSTARDINWSICMFQGEPGRSGKSGVSKSFHSSDGSKTFIQMKKTTFTKYIPHKEQNKILPEKSETSKTVKVDLYPPLFHS